VRSAVDKRFTLRNLLLPMSVVLFVLSLGATAVPPGYPGIWILVFGWAELFLGHGAVSPLVLVAWLANPLLAIVWLFDSIGSQTLHRIALILACAAAVLGLGVCGQGVATSEAGGVTGQIGFEPGYWLWVGSILAALLRALLPLAARTAYEPT
jgi:hypothetical protein